VQRYELVEGAEPSTSTDHAAASPPTGSDAASSTASSPARSDAAANTAPLGFCVKELAIFQQTTQLKNDEDENTAVGALRISAFVKFFARLEDITGVTASESDLIVYWRNCDNNMIGEHLLSEVTTMTAQYAYPSQKHILSRKGPVAASPCKGMNQWH
jgi:hypothetical protein